MSRDAHIPLILWVCAAICAHFVLVGGGDQVAQVHEDRVATVHANDSMSGLIRLQSLVAEATQAPQQDLIGAAIDVVVFIDEDLDHVAGRKVREIMLVNGFREGAYQCDYV